MAFGNDSNTIALLTLDNDIVDDALGGSLTWTNNNGVTFDNTIKKFGYSGVFNGSNQYLDASDTTSYSAFTVDCWARFDTVGGGQQFITANRAGSGSRYGWEILKHTDDTVFFVMETDEGSVAINSSSTVSANTWYHFAGVWDGSTARFFFDGTQEGGDSSRGGSAFQPSANQQIGRETGGNYFDGRIDEFRISNVARWTSNFTPPTEPYTSPSEFDFTVRPFSSAVSSLSAFTIRPNSVAASSLSAFTLRPKSVAESSLSAFTIRPESLAFTTFSAVTFRPQGYGPKRYNVYIYDTADGSLVDSTTVNHPTVSADFTTPADGTYRADIWPEYMWEGKYPQSSIIFTISGGVLQPLLPNAPYNLSATLGSAGRVTVKWIYNSNNQSVAPSQFNVYKGTTGSPLAVDYGTAIGTVAYSTDGEYSFTTGTLSEIPTIFGVRAETAAAYEEENTVTVTVTPDATAPEDIPFQFGWEQ